MDHKIVCIGAHKTGTTSLTYAMKHLGFTCAPEAKWYNNIRARNRLCLHDSYDTFIDIMLNNPEYQFYEDSPYNYNDIYKYIDRKFPNVKFILTIRSSSNWFDSFLRWINLMKTNNAITEIEKRESLYGYGYEVSLANKHKLIRRYCERNLEIMNYFKHSGKLLILNFELLNDKDVWTNLCKFLQIQQIPTVPFPHMNKSKETINYQDNQ